ncbi:UPF0545 protein C22orf39 homolog [Leptidea sinapis]|uniref:Synaptic plasticity regulator PANTS n=1 Tax=Leptidea sinapis TaxID=189913 RepID=A0A5E4QHB0_9NEOP|nr:UPF0545 protein C22orf39 homolog [Leptidea sinapis]VVC96922.1 unnamed protein product [Leptidea sinapis]
MSQKPEKDELDKNHTVKPRCEETNETSPDNNTTETNLELEIEDKWLIRECDIYEDEYDECTSIKARFHQYFVYGETLDCNQWKRDYDNCCKWRDDKDIKAGVALINSEKERRMQRLRAHYRNDVWKKRDTPPDDWAAPLPEWMAKRDENTYLAKKAQEMREGKETAENTSSCCVM